jgi:hypothetical protein
VPAWNSVPNPKVNPASTLAGVVAISATDVWAVGNNGGGSNGQALIEQWNGTSWNVIPSVEAQGSVQGRFLGVAAITASNVWAVGITALTDQFCC